MDKMKNANIWHLAKYLKSYTFLIVTTMVFLVIGRVASSFDPIWLKKIIDGVGQGFSLQQMGIIIGVYFGLKAISALFDYLRDLVFAPAEMGIARTLSKVLFTHLISLPISFHVDQKIGGLSRQITRGGRAITFILDIMVINILPTIIDLIVSTLLLLKLYEPVYAITTFLTVVVYTVFTVWATDKRQKYRLGANLADDEVASLEVDALTNIDTVKYFNNEEHLLKSYEPAIKKRYWMAVASNKLFALISAGQALIILVGLGIILYLAIKQTLAHILTIGDLVLLTTYIVRLSAPIDVLGFIYRQIKDGLADLDGMARILEVDSNIIEPQHPKPIQHPRGKVTFEHLSFNYSKRNILNDINLTIQPGQQVAFVGPSGVGKSTIVKLLFRLYDPEKGQILIDDINLKDLDRKTRRQLFAIVPQEPALFNTTIAENIRFGKPDATLDEIKKAAQLASIDKFVETLPKKYETVVGERGVKLSGGEKQRVAIARSIIRDPKILVFDEATSSLDSKSEREIQKSLTTVSKGRTTISVAHRLSTIAKSDIIYVLNKGIIVEQGKHNQLLAKKGLYAKLWLIQASNKDTHE